MATNESGSLIESIKNPLAFYSLALIILESIIAISATIKFSNEELLFRLFLILIAVFIVVISVVTYVAIKHPNQLMGEMEKVAKSIIVNLSDFNRDILFKLHAEGELQYAPDGDKDNYKDLRNMGLIRTRSRQAMRKDNTILLTELGILIVGEIRKNTK